jgi:A/G-specific adenine glycosylase
MAKTSFSAPEPRDLLRWYGKAARDLPWRSHQGRAPSPYHTWLSEIMLQQTTVATVIPYYLKFIQKWPAVQALAAAHEDDVLQEWAGLGYYSRARNLLKCARMVVSDFGGEFPEDIVELKKLPGVGDYTANAIRAIAFDKTANVVDGNVERVVSRIFAFDKPLNEFKNKAQVKQLAASLAPQKHPGDYAQAVMDLGATICTPRQPKCTLCPWQKNCRALALGKQEIIPVIERRKKLPERFTACFVMYDAQGRYFMRQRPSSGLLGGLWEFPSDEWNENDSVSAKDFPLPEKGFIRLPKPHIHVFTHFKLTTAIFVHQKAVAAEKLRLAGSWQSLDQLPALSTLTSKILLASRKDKKLGDTN